MVKSGSVGGEGWFLSAVMDVYSIYIYCIHSANVTFCMGFLSVYLFTAWAMFVLCVLNWRFWYHCFIINALLLLNNRITGLPSGWMDGWLRAQQEVELGVGDWVRRDG